VEETIEKQKKELENLLVSKSVYLTMGPVNRLFEKAVSSMLKLETHRGATQSD
jgi:hypothetical protein